MKNFLIVLLLIVISAHISSVNAESLTVTTPAKYPTPYYYRPQLDKNELSALEKYALKKTYPREYPLQRLERLENLAFGAVQTGDLATRFDNVENAILSRPTQNSYTRNSLFNNLANWFVGQPTGYTPPIIPDYQNYYTPVYNYNNPWGSQSYLNQRYDQFSNGIFGSRYNVMNHNYGNGSSVRILP